MVIGVYRATFTIAGENRPQPDTHRDRLLKNLTIRTSRNSREPLSVGLMIAASRRDRPSIAAMGSCIGSPENFLPERCTVVTPPRRVSDPLRQSALVVQSGEIVTQTHSPSANLRHLLAVSAIFSLQLSRKGSPIHRSIPCCTGPTASESAQDHDPGSRKCSPQPGFRRPGAPQTSYVPRLPQLLTFGHQPRKTQWIPGLIHKQSVRSHISHTPVTAHLSVPRLNARVNANAPENSHRNDRIHLVDPGPQLDISCFPG